MITHVCLLPFHVFPFVVYLYIFVFCSHCLLFVFSDSFRRSYVNTSLLVCIHPSFLLLVCLLLLF